LRAKQVGHHRSNGIETVGFWGRGTGCVHDMVDRKAGGKRVGRVLHQQPEGAMLQQMTKTKLRALPRTRKCDDFYPDTALCERKQAIDKRARQHPVRAGDQDRTSIERRPSGRIRRKRIQIVDDRRMPAEKFERRQALPPGRSPAGRG
jgi:hypothetical protein